jgi:cell division protein ZapA
MEASEAQKVKVQIYNESYTIVVADGNADHVQELAALVDKRMREIVSGSRTVDSRKVAILAALHIAEDLYKMRAEHEKLDRKLAERSAECADLLDQILKKQ